MPGLPARGFSAPEPDLRPVPAIVTVCRTGTDVDFTATAVNDARTDVDADISVGVDAGTAPDGPDVSDPIFEDLAGMSPLRRVVSTLHGSPAISRIIVAVPPRLAGAVADHLGAGPEDVPDVVTADGAGPLPWVRAALAALPADEPYVVLHDPSRPLAPADLIPILLGALAGRSPDEPTPGNGDGPDADGAGPVDGVVPVRPVTDTLKRVDRDVIVATADRDTYWVVCTPQAYRVDALRRGLDDAIDVDRDPTGTDLLPRLVRAAGGRLRTAPAPPDSPPVRGRDGILLAAALLDLRRSGSPGPGTEPEPARAGPAVPRG